MKVLREKFGNIILIDMYMEVLICFDWNISCKWRFESENSKEWRFIAGKIVQQWPRDLSDVAVSPTRKDSSIFQHYMSWYEWYPHYTLSFSIVYLIPSGKLLHNYGNSPCFWWENSRTVNLVVRHCQRVYKSHQFPWNMVFNTTFQQAFPMVYS